MTVAPPTPGGADAGPHDAPVRRLLFVGWWCVMAVLPIGHLTGLRNALTTVVVTGTLLWVGRQGWRDLPARWWALATLAWCAASIGWSVVPATSFGKWRVDLLLPMLAYAAAFGYVRRCGRVDAIVGGTLTGIALLALLSLPALLPDASVRDLATVVRTETFATITHPMPVWFPGVGDASMAAALATVGVLLAGRVASPLSRPRTTIVAVVFASSILLILVAINNRNATLTIPIVGLAAVWLDRRRASVPDAGKRIRRRVAVVTIVVLLSAGALALLETGARQRLRQMGTPVADDRSGLVTLTEHDTRPMIWSYYTELALRRPLAGVGFGRTVPGITWHTQEDKELERVEGNAYSHAHNLLLDWWLQTGVVGVVLLVGTLGAVVARAWRGRGAAHTRRRAASTTVIALMAAMLLRNMTDDFLVFGMASMFWILVGTFAAATLSDEPAISASRAP